MQLNWNSIKSFIIVFMIVSLSLSPWFPFSIAAFISSAILLFGVIVIETRHDDNVQALSNRIMSVEISISTFKSKLITMDDILKCHKEYATKIADKTDLVSSRLDKLEPEKIKTDMQTLIDLHNQMALKMSSPF